MLLWPFNHYPGTDYETFNWDWLISLGKKIENWAKDIMEYLTRAETAADDAETAAAVAEAAKNEILSRYHATPQAYGAVGDGVTDDTAAIQDMFDDTDAPVYFPEGVYLISQPIIDDEPDRDVYMEGEIKYTGPAIGLTLKNKYNCFLVINTEPGLATYVPNSTGAKLQNCNSCTIIIKKANMYENGCIFEGNNAGFAYNKIWIMNVLNNLKGLRCVAAGTGWINENQYFGGRFSVFSGASYESSAVGVSIEGTSAHVANANTFYNPAFEHLGTGMYLDYAAYNTFKNVRCENVPNKMLNGSNAHSNTYSASYSVNSATTQTGLNRYVGMEQTGLYDEGFTGHATSGNLIGKVAATNTKTAASGLCKIDTGVIYNIPFSGCGVGVNNGLQLAANRTAGLEIEIDPEAVYHVSAKANAGVRYCVYMYDENGNTVTDAPSTRSFIGGTGAMNLTTTGLLSGGYVGGGNIDSRGLYIRFPDSVKRAYIGIFVTASTELYSIDVRSTGPNIINYTPTFMALDGAPTSTGLPGQTCVDTSGNMYIYDGSAWKTVAAS